MTPAVLPRLLVFDLDGTLIDSRIDLTNSVNAMLAHFGKPVLEPPTIAGYIGDGAAALVQRALAHAYVVTGEDDPHDTIFLDQALDWFIRYYHVHKLDYTYVYPGVLESLAQIRRGHPALPMAVLTNKPVRPSRAICEHLGLNQFFFANYGGNSFTSKKPDPFGLLRLIHEASALKPAEPPIKPEQTVMIGDSHVDVETARACGARSLGCAFGLSPATLAQAGPDVTVDSATEWIQALGLD